MLELYVIPLQTDGAIHHIDKDSIQLAGQNSQSRQIKGNHGCKNNKVFRYSMCDIFF